jgi:hypothetical protein
MKYKFVVDVMNEVITQIGEKEKQKFIREYKRMLRDGFYLAKSKETKLWISSNKFIEKHTKQVLNQDEFLKNIFIQV